MGGNKLFATKKRKKEKPIPTPPNLLSRYLGEHWVCPLCSDFIEFSDGFVDFVNHCMSQDVGKKVDYKPPQSYSTRARLSTAQAHYSSDPRHSNSTNKSRTAVMSRPISLTSAVQYRKPVVRGTKSLSRGTTFTILRQLPRSRPRKNGTQEIPMA